MERKKTIGNIELKVTTEESSNNRRLAKHKHDKIMITKKE